MTRPLDFSSVITVLQNAACGADRPAFNAAIATIRSLHRLGKNSFQDLLVEFYCAFSYKGVELEEIVVDSDSFNRLPNEFAKVDENTIELMTPSGRVELKRKPTPEPINMNKLDCDDCGKRQLQCECNQPTPQPLPKVVAYLISEIDDVRSLLTGVMLSSQRTQEGYETIVKPCEQAIAILEKAFMDGEPVFAKKESDK